MASERAARLRAYARRDFDKRLTRIRDTGFIADHIVDALPEFARTRPSEWRLSVVHNDGGGPATAVYELAGAPRVYAKLYRDASGRHAYQMLTGLWRDGFGPGQCYQVARPLRFVTDLNLLLSSGAEGTPIESSSSDVDDMVAAARQAARWLVRLHRSPVRLGQPRYAWWAYDDLLHRLARAATAHPEHVDALLEMADRLQRHASRMEPRFVQTHGQFRHTSVFLTASAVTVIDLDRSRPADPAQDLAEFVHRLRTDRFKATGGQCRADAASAAFLDEYAAELPENLDNLGFYWGYLALASLWRVMGGSSGEATGRPMADYYLSEFERATVFRPDRPAAVASPA